MKDFFINLIDYVQYFFEHILGVICFAYFLIYPFAVYIFIKDKGFKNINVRHCLIFIIYVTSVILVFFIKEFRDKDISILILSSFVSMIWLGFEDIITYFKNMYLDHKEIEKSCKESILQIRFASLKK